MSLYRKGIFCRGYWGISQKPRVGMWQGLEDPQDRDADAVRNIPCFHLLHSNLPLSSDKLFIFF